MSVTITTPGRFPPAFRWARYLQSQGNLERIISPVPQGRLRQYGVAPEHVVSRPLLGAWDHGFQRIGPRFLQPAHQHAFSTVFDRVAARSLGRCTVVNAWCSTALSTIREAHRRGIPAVVESASAHVEAQAELIREEMRRWGALERTALSGAVIARTAHEYAEADVIIVNSQFALRTFVERGVPAEKIIAVPYAVDETQAVERRPHDGRPRILFVGGCSLRKGVPYLLEAWRSLRSRAELRLVGAPNRRMLQRLGAGSGVVAVGHKTGAALAEEYASADIFVLPSVEDGYGLVTIEAMQAGLPVIVSDHAGSSELVRDGVDGFVVPARDSGALRDRIQRLIDEPRLRRSMGESARERAASRTWDDYGRERMDLVFGRLLGLSDYAEVA